MIDENMEEQACLYACDQLVGDELLAFEKELATNPELRSLVQELRESSAALTLSCRSTEMPSEGLRDRVLASFGSKRGVRVKPRKVLGFFLKPQVAWGLAGALAVVSGFLYLQSQTAATSSQAANAEIATANAEIRSLQQQIEAERILGSQQLAELKQAADISSLRVAHLSAAGRDAQPPVATAVWNPLSQEGMLCIHGLPEIDGGKDYQLWIIDPQYPDPVDGGCVPLDKSGVTHVRFHPKVPTSEVTKFAISLEKKGGVPKAQGPIVAIGGL